MDLMLVVEQYEQQVAKLELLKHGQAFQDLGRDYFDKLNEDRVKRQLVTRLEKLGYAVVLEKKDAA